MVHGALLTAVSKLHKEIRQHLSTQDPKPKIVSHGHENWNKADSRFKPCCSSSRLESWYPGDGKATNILLALLHIARLFLNLLFNFCISCMLDVEPDMVQIRC